ncbi:MAG: MATE family efflux transporter [Vulcanimicrobiaceae bacterium]
MLRLDLRAAAAHPRHLLRRVRGSELVGQGALVFAAMMFMNLCGFIFHAIASRRLGVDEYGALYALISAYALVGTPAAIATTVIARFAAEFSALHDDGHLRALTIRVAEGVGMLGGVYVVAGLVFDEPLSRFMHVPDWTVPMVMILGAVAMLSASLRAVSQGTQDFLGFSISAASEGLVKVLVVGALAFVGFGLLGGIASFFAGVFAGCTLIAIRLASRYGKAKTAVLQLDWRRIAATTGGAAALTVALTLMGSGDVVLVKHYFSADQAGLYSAASLGGKILLYLVGFAPTVLLPAAANRHARGLNAREPLVFALAMTLVLAGVGLGGFMLFGPLVLRALVGRAFAAASGLLVWYGLSMTLLAITSLVGSYSIATHRMAFAIPLVLGTLGTLGAIVLIHGTLFHVVLTMVVGNAVTLAVVSGSLAYQSRHGLAGKSA